jgi:hypothetical protein
MTMIKIGLDVGVTRTGVVMDTDSDLHYATFHSDSAFDFSQYPTASRVADLAVEIVNWIIERDELADDNVFIICMERPIYNKSPKNFEIQWRLFQELQGALVPWAEATYIEVNPKTVKSVAKRGGATKDEMIDSSPFRDFDRGTSRNSEQYKNIEALADAYHIMRCIGKPVPQTKVDLWDEKRPKAANPGPAMEGTIPHHTP